MADEDEEIPENILWNEKEMMFFDITNKRMGGKFFDKWKDRRGEFPNSAEEISGATPAAPRRSRTPRIAGPTNTVPAEPLPLVLGDDFLELAKLRKAMFDAYLQVGFTEEQALELCVR